MRIGLKDLHYAPITTSADGVEKYGKPVRMAKAIQANLTPNVAEATLYADDDVDVNIKRFTSGALTLGLNDLKPAIQAVLLGQRQDEDGVVYAGEYDDPPHLAVGFRALRADGTYRYLWLYKCKFALPNENHDTKGSNITFQTPQLTGTFVRRPDGNWKADWTGSPDDDVAKKWLTEVREPNFADTPGGGG